MEASQEDLNQGQDPDEGEIAVGESGDDRMQPQGAEDGHGSTTPSSAPPPESQSGVPLSEDREAGVEAGAPTEPPPNPDVAETPGAGGVEPQHGV